MIPFAEFAPDRSDLDPDASDTIRNVIPRSKSYGPFPSFVHLTDALPDAPKGAILAIDGNSFQIFAGTKEALYKLDQVDLEWEDVSKAATTYAVGDEDAWAFIQFGNLVVAANKVDATQKFTLGSSTEFADLGGPPPKALHLGVIGDFLVHLNVEASERQMTWSGLNAPEMYTPRKQCSDFQVFPDGGALQGFAGFERGAVVFQEKCIREMGLALDSPLIFTFRKTDETRGCVAPRSIVCAGGMVFFLAQEGFFRYGAPSTPIGTERVDEFFINDCDPAALYQVQGAADPSRKIVYWRYRSRGHSNPDTTDRVLIYHYALDRWSLAQVELSWLLQVASPGYTLDNLDGLGYTLDSLPFSLDSRMWAAGAPLIGGFDASFRLGFFSGAPLEAVLQTGDVELNPGRRTFVSAARPVVDGGIITGRMATKSTHTAPRVWGGSVAMQETGILPARAEGRLHRAEITIAAGTDWQHAHGLDFEAKATGRR